MILNLINNKKNEWIEPHGQRLETDVKNIIPRN